MIGGDRDLDKTRDGWEFYKAFCSDDNGKGQVQETHEITNQ
jgi:hypothetical protein